MTDKSEDSSPYKFMIQHIDISKDMGREEIPELGRRGPYHKYVNFPVEIEARWIGGSTEEITLNDSAQVQYYENWPEIADEVTSGQLTVAGLDSISDLLNRAELEEVPAGVIKFTRPHEQRECDCDIFALMREGCTCGGK